MENGKRQRRLQFIILAAALADGLIVGGALFFVWWMATRGASGGPAVPVPSETGGNTPGLLIWLPLLLALLMPLTTLPMILLLRKRLTGGSQTAEGTKGAMMDRLSDALGGAEGRPEGTEGSSQQNRTFVLLVAAIGGMLLLAFVALYVFLLQTR